MKAIFLGDAAAMPRAYSAQQLTALQQLATIDAHVYTAAEARTCEEVRTAEVIFSTWGMPQFTTEEIAQYFPALRAVFYAAGSVQAFAEPFLQRGIAVFSAWQANAVPVAEFTVAQIVLAAKGYFRLHRMTHEDRAAAARETRCYPGMYDIRVGLLGLGAIGSLVAQRLQSYHCQVLAFDPFASDEKMARLGVQRADMETVFAQCHIISNHIANLPTTQGIIRREHLFAMKPYTTFINTGRGAQLNEEDLLAVLTQQPTITALLDVVTDEAHVNQNPLCALPNCFLTPHLAGSIGQEVRRMGDYMVEEYARWQTGQSLRYQVTLDMLHTMA